MASREERVEKLRDAVKLLAAEIARLQCNLDRAHKLQRVLVNISQQLVEEYRITDDKNYGQKLTN